MSPPRLSCARRFVLVNAGGQVVADGVVFACDGPVVLHPRATGTAEVYPAQALQLAPFVDHLEWIDAERPSPCGTTTGRHAVTDQPQHPIKGYRQLTDDEIATMNRIKELEGQIGLLWQEIKERPGVDQRHLAIARTQIEDGFMWFNRSIAQPVSPFDA